MVLFIPFITGLAGLAATGTIGRVQRNEPAMLSAALFLVLGAGALWLISSQLKASPKAVRVAASAVAFLGFVLGFYATVSTANDEPRPQISASLSDDARKLTAEVSASNLETEDRLAIFVDVFNREGGEFFEFVSSAYEGPDADGNVEITLSTNLPKGPYTDVSVKAFTGQGGECNDLMTEKEKEEVAKGAGGEKDEPILTSGTGCVVLPIVSR